MESAIDHPCQSLADWKTMDELGVPANGGKFVLSWAYHPQALPLAVPSATLHMAAKRGMNVRAPAAAGLRAAARDHGENAPGGRRVGRQRQRDHRPPRGDGRCARRLREGVLVDASLRRQDRATRSCARISSAPGASTSRGSRTRAPDCQVHALPARAPRRRGHRSNPGRPRSVVIQEARNRMFVQMAVLYRMMKG